MVHEIAENLFCVGGTHVNWVLVREGTELTLIDGGFPGDTAAVEASIRAIGRCPEDVRAVLLTHAHVDHMGVLNHLHNRFGVPVYADPREVAHARREYLEQASPMDVVKRAWRPTALVWGLRITRAGALRRVSVPHAQPFPNSGQLELPGRPVPVACHGHTSGHSAYHLPAAGVLVSGDALITGHPLSRFTGPQLTPVLFSHSQSEALTALDALADIDADTLLPGHGDPWHGPIRTAVATARDRALA